MKEEKPSVAEIASLVGVSTATVSRVITGNGRVSTATRERVEVVLQNRGHPKERRKKAREKKGGGKVVAVQIHDFRNPFCGGLLEGIYDEAEKLGFEMIVIGVHEEVDVPRIVANLSAHHIDGIISSASNFPLSVLARFYEEWKVPVVLVNRQIDHLGIPSIMIDFENSSYQRTYYLILMNHVRIGFINGPDRMPGPSVFQGYERAMRTANLAILPEWLQRGMLNAEGGFQAMSMLLALPRDRRPTAVVTSNDLMAFGAMDAIRMHGLHVPEDISIIGFDDILMAAHSDPPLTTISIPKYRMGMLAMQLLAQIDSNGGLPKQSSLIMMESPLMIRKSVSSIEPGRQ